MYFYQFYIFSGSVQRVRFKTSAHSYIYFCYWLSLTGCELPYYGVNCSQECKCGPGVDRCDPVSGCVCQSGWTRNNCDTDIDECQENPIICGDAMICHNTEGSYRCDCQNGFQLLDEKCQGKHCYKTCRYFPKIKNCISIKPL